MFSRGRSHFIKTADQMKLVFVFLFTVLKIYKMAVPPREHRMNREALAEIFADRDSDVSDFSDSEFEPSVSEESEEEEEDESEENETGEEADVEEREPENALKIQYGGRLEGVSGCGREGVNKGGDFINFCLKKGIFYWTIKSLCICSTN